MLLDDRFKSKSAESIKQERAVIVTSKQEGARRPSKQVWRLKWRAWTRITKYRRHSIRHDRLKQFASGYCLESAWSDSYRPE